MVMKGIPEHIRLDNGPEFVARELRTWLADTGAKTLCIQPGSPWENGCYESFNSKLRDEFLSGEIYYSMKELHVLAERWRIRQGFLNDPQPLRRAELPALGRDWRRRRNALAAANDPSILSSWTSFVHKPRMPTHPAQVHTALTGVLRFRGQKGNSGLQLNYGLFTSARNSLRS